MSADKKRELIELVRRSAQPKRTTIAELGLSRSTFYRWEYRSTSRLSQLHPPE